MSTDKPHLAREPLAGHIIVWTAICPQAQPEFHLSILCLHPYKKAASLQPQGNIFRSSPKRGAEGNQ